MTVNSKGGNSEVFCPNNVQEFCLRNHQRYREVNALSSCHIKVFKQIRLWSKLESYRRFQEVKKRFKMSSNNNNKWFKRLLLHILVSARTYSILREKKYMFYSGKNYTRILFNKKKDFISRFYSISENFDPMDY